MTKMGVVYRGSNAISKPSIKLRLAGWLNIIAGSVLTIAGIFLIAFDIGCALYLGEGFHLFVPGIILFVLGTLALRGGYNALKCKNWGRVLTGSICVVFCAVCYVVFFVVYNVVYGGVFYSSLLFAFFKTVKTNLFLPTLFISLIALSKSK